MSLQGSVTSGAVLATHGEEANGLASRSWQSLAEEIITLRAQNNILQGGEDLVAEVEHDLEQHEVRGVVGAGDEVQGALPVQRPSFVDVQKAAEIWNSIRYTTRLAEAMRRGTGDNFTWKHFLSCHCGVHQADACAYECSLIEERIAPDFVLEVAAKPEAAAETLRLVGFAAGDIGRIINTVQGAVQDVLQAEEQLLQIPELDERADTGHCDFECFADGLNELQSMVSPADVAFSSRVWKSVMSKALPPARNLLFHFHYTSLDYLKDAPAITLEAAQHSIVQRRKVLARSLAHQQEGLEGSNTHDVAGMGQSEVSRPLSVSSQMSCSVLSAAASHQFGTRGLTKKLAAACACCCCCFPAEAGFSSAHCFIPGTFFKGPCNQLIPVEQLQQDCVVLGSDGCPLSIRSITMHPPSMQSLVELHTQTASLTVTKCHRVVVPRGCELRTRAAGALKVGEPIMCSGGEAILTQISYRAEETKVIEIVFDPDKSVECVLLQDEHILTRGAAHRSQTRRGGMRRRMQRHASASDNISIPDTHNSWD